MKGGCGCNSGFRSRAGERLEGKGGRTEAVGADLTVIPEVVCVCVCVCVCGTHHDSRGLRTHEGAHNAHVCHGERWSNWTSRTWQRGEAGGGRPGQHAKGRNNWASRRRKHGKACGGRPERNWALRKRKCSETCGRRPERGGECTAKTVKRPPPNQHNPSAPTTGLH